MTNENITIPFYEDRPTTKQGFLEHVKLDRFKKPMDIGEIVSFRGNYGCHTFAAICGCQLRDAGWYYFGRKATPTGYEHVEFSEKDIL